MDRPSIVRRRYVWAVEIDTFEDRTGTLLFQSAEGSDYGVGYTLRLLQEHGEPTAFPCMSLSEQSYASYDADRTTQQHICAPPLATDDDLLALSQARYVELILSGTARQLFLRSVRVVERDLPADLAAHYPPPPPPPVLG